MSLSDVRLVDCSSGIAGAYLARLFCDAGAEVVRVEPSEGTALRRRSAVPLGPGEDGAMFRFLAAGTRSVSAGTGEPIVDELLAGADVAVVDATTSPTEVGTIADRHPHLVIVSIRPYGLEGPWAERAADEFLVQADAGSVMCRGQAGRMPFAAGADIFEWTTASYAAPAALAALDRARRCGVGDVVDVSMAEVTAIAASTFSDLANQFVGGDVPSGRSLETPSIEPAADGWVGFNTNTRAQFQAFCLLIERPDLMESEWADLRVRSARLDEWESIVAAWTTAHPVDEVLARASELRVPVARVNDGAGVLAEEQLVAREFFVDHPGGFRAPSPPRLLDGERPPVPGSVPTPGEANGELGARERPTFAARGSDDADARPLAGVRVVDMTSWWAGPSSTQVMAALGADVIHVESIGHPDGMRLTGIAFGADDWWEWGHMFVAANNDKRGVTLDLSRADGRELLLRLVDRADVVVENFSPRVLEQFDLGWDVIHARNPDAVMMRMPAFGLEGPWRDRVGFAQTMEQMSGMAWLTGHPDDQPRIMRGPCDPIAGMHGCFAVLLALRQRERLGRGVFVESPMVEAAVNCSAELIVEWSANRVSLSRTGNRSRFVAPQGIYAAAADDAWVAVSVQTDDQWRSLAGLLGVEADRWATVEDRAASHDEVDELIEQWTAQRSPDEAEAALTAVGVPAIACRNHGLLRMHPQFRHRGFYEEVAHPAVGTHLMPAQPYRMRGIDRWIRHPTPTLGEHNREVLGEIGCTDAEINALEEDGLIGTVPVF